MAYRVSCYTHKAVRTGYAQRSTCMPISVENTTANYTNLMVLLESWWSAHLRLHI